MPTDRHLTKLKSTLRDVFTDLATSFPALSLRFCKINQVRDIITAQAPNKLIGFALIETGGTLRHIHIEQNPTTDAYILRLRDQSAEPTRSYGYSLIVQKSQISNPAKWQIDQQAAHNHPRAQAYLKSSNVTLAQSMPDNLHTAVGGAVGFMLDGLLPSLVDGALNKVSCSWEKKQGAAAKASTLHRRRDRLTGQASRRRP